MTAIDPFHCESSDPTDKRSAFLRQLSYVLEKPNTTLLCKDVFGYLQYMRQ